VAAIAPGVAPGEPAPGAVRTYRDDIDGLRAVSILLVVAFHAGVTGVAGGYVGVDVFFVLSGYLITGLLVAEQRRTGRIALAEFFARRARRLLPMAGLVIVATLLAGLWLLPPLARADMVRDAGASALYLANWRFAGQVTAYSDAAVTDGLFLHFWSLAIEEQFYLAWPLLVLLVGLLVRRRPDRLPAVLGLVLAGLVVASLTTSIVLTRSLGPEAYYLTHARLWELAAGALLAVVLPRVPRPGRRLAEALGTLGLAAILFAALTFDAATAFPGWRALLPVLGAVGIIVAGTRDDTRTSRMLALRPLPSLGRVSYAWYLWHWPALGVAALWAGRHGVDDTSVTVTAVAVAGSLVLAMVTHVTVENPVRNARALKARPGRSLALAATLSGAPLLLGVAILGLADPGEEPVTAAPAGMTAREAAEDRVELPCAPVDDGCVYGDPRGERTVVLLGDSHAEHWLPAFDAAGRRAGWRVLEHTMGACAFVDVELWDYRRERPFEECAEWREDVLEELASDPVDVVVLGRTYRYEGLVLDDTRTLLTDPDRVASTWEAGIRRTFTALEEVADEVVALRDTPWAPEDVPTCLSSAPARPGTCAFRVDAHAGLDDVLHHAEVAAATERVSFADLTTTVCPEDPCPAVTDDGVVIFRDRHHLTQTYARSLAPAVEARFMRSAERDER
jgi:peptidoglycan/LPS O-acetylase OafA/YrhL